MSQIREIDPVPVAEPGAWQALHIYYAANPQPMLVRCIRPLVRELTDEGLIVGHFFINYWLEGPHVRLRLRPASAAVTETVLRRAEEAIERFISIRPALYQVDPGFLNDFYNTLFDAEFDEAGKAAYIGADGRMNLRPNNSSARQTYEPEFGKYGGPAGVELAEWHFQRSSDLVIEAMGSLNLHMRTVLLGTSAQLMMVMGQSFLPEVADLADFLDRYYEFWHRTFPGKGFIGDQEYARNYDGMAEGLNRRFGEIRSALVDGSPQALPGYLRDWAEHCAELVSRVHTLATDGDLVFRSWDRTQDQAVTDPSLAGAILLSPYLHMTNNRLQVTMRDEAYLAYVMGRSLKDLAPDTRPRTPGPQEFVPRRSSAQQADEGQLVGGEVR